MILKRQKSICQKAANNGARRGRNAKKASRGCEAFLCVYGVLELADRGDDDGVVVDRWIGAVAGEGAP